MVTGRCRKATQSNSRLCRDRRGHKHRTFKKQGESGLHLFGRKGAPPFRPFLFLWWTAAAIAKTAGFRKPALQLPAQLKTEKEFPFIIGAWTTNRLHGFYAKPHNCWKSTARSSGATGAMRRRRS